MSSTLNLLSDNTFGDKLDEQNVILEDIRDSLGGGLDTSSLVYGGTPDVDSVVQLKKKDPVSGNDINVYPALAPNILGTLYIPSSTPSLTDILFLCSGRNFASFVTPTYTSSKKALYTNLTNTNYWLWIQKSIITGAQNMNANEFLSHIDLHTDNAFIRDVYSDSYNGVSYFGYNLAACGNGTYLASVIGIYMRV